jgi:hypothetical protein
MNIFNIQIADIIPLSKVEPIAGTMCQIYEVPGKWTWEAGDILICGTCENYGLGKSPANSWVKSGATTYLAPDDTRRQFVLVKVLKNV